MHLVSIVLRNFVSKRWSGGFSAHNFKMVAFRASPFVASHSLMADLIEEAACALGLNRECDLRNIRKRKLSTLGSGVMRNKSRLGGAILTLAAIETFSNTRNFLF